MKPNLLLFSFLWSMLLSIKKILSEIYKRFLIFTVYMCSIRIMRKLICFFLLLIKVPKHCPIQNLIVLGIIRTKIDCWQPEDQWLKVSLSYIVKFEGIMSYMRSCAERLPESLYPSLCTKSKSRWVKDFK